MSAIHPKNLWTVVPVRGLADGKSRLATVLDPAARAELNRRLLSLTLEAIERWQGDASRCVVVSPCAEARELAAGRGAVALSEPGAAGGLNAAAALGAAHAARNGAHAVLILPCDLPGLTPGALAALERAAATSRHFVIAPDRSGAGTNALLLPAGGGFGFRFGEQSCARHLALAAEHGWTAAVVSRPELAFDLDTPEDLAIVQPPSGTRRPAEEEA